MYLRRLLMINCVDFALDIPRFVAVGGEDNRVTVFAIEHQLTQVY